MRRGAEAFLLLLAFAIACPGSALADHKRVFLAPDDHTDYYWSATGDDYSLLFTEMLDYYLDQADATKGEPANLQSRFSADGSLWLWEYAKNKNVADFQRLVDALKDGHISAPLNPLVITYGGVPAEGVIRSMYYPGQLERRYGLDFPLAIAMENAGMPYGLGAVWAGAGAEYSWKGVCSCPSLIPGLQNRAREIYNWIGPDGSRILMKWNSLHGPDNESMGGYAEARRPSEVLDYVTRDAGFAARYPYNTIGAFGQGWDDFSTRNLLIQQTCKSNTDPNRTCIVSDSVDFFREFDSLYGQAIPTLAASFGNEWDLSPASMAEVSARVKRSLEALRSAEALATLVALRDPSFLDGRDVARDKAFLDLGLYFEHDFENGGPQSRRPGPDRLAAPGRRRDRGLREHAHHRCVARARSADPEDRHESEVLRLQLPELDEDGCRRHPVLGRVAGARARSHDRSGRPVPDRRRRRHPVSPRPGAERPVGRLQGLRDPAGRGHHLHGQPDGGRSDRRDRERVLPPHSLASRCGDELRRQAARATASSPGAPAASRSTISAQPAGHSPSRTPARSR